jgi:copper chaperone CopZ
MIELTVIDDTAASAAATTPEPKETTVSENATTAVYTVSGMTCGHCVKSVTEEVSAIAGVTSVEVELDTGKVTITSAVPLAETDVKAAVDEAGYALVG